MGAKDGHFIMIKGALSQEDITLLSVWCTQLGSTKIYKAATNRTKGRNWKTNVVADLNTPLTALDRASKWKINKEISALNDTLDQMDIIDICRTVLPRTSDYTFFSST